METVIICPQLKALSFCFALLVFFILTKNLFFLAKDNFILGE